MVDQKVVDISRKQARARRWMRLVVAVLLPLATLLPVEQASARNSSCDKERKARTLTCTLTVTYSEGAYFYLYVDHARYRPPLSLVSFNRTVSFVVTGPDGFRTEFQLESDEDKSFEIPATGNYQISGTISRTGIIKCCLRLKYSVQNAT
jgi:hypothetical protein